MTAAQRRAINRHNARNSTGPITPEGKERTRKNALKHGLCARTLSLSHENADDLQEQFDEWIEHYQPVGPAEFALVEEIAVAQLRLRRCRLREAAAVELQVVSAYDVWRSKQASSLRAVFARMVTDPIAVEDLRGSRDGRLWMIDRWNQVGEMLLRDRYASASSWVDEGVRLLGGDVAQPAAGPLSGYEFRLVCAGAQPKPDAKYVAWLLSDTAIHPDYLAQYGREVPAPAACRDRVDQIIKEETEALESEDDGAEDEEADAYNARLRAQVPSDSPDTKLALRYESMARAALHKALKALEMIQDARYTAEAEAGAADATTRAETPPKPLPSVSRNEPEPPQEPPSSAELVKGCDASADTNSDDSSSQCAAPSRAARATPERAEPSVAARPSSSPSVVPVVPPVTAPSPPA